MHHLKTMYCHHCHILDSMQQRNSSLSLGLSLSLCLSASRLSKTLFFYNFPVFPSIISSVRVCKLGFEVLSLSPPLASRQWECCCLHGWQLLKRSNCWSSLDRFCVGFLEVCAARGLSLPLSLSQSISCSRFFSLNRSLSLSLKSSDQKRGIISSGCDSCFLGTTLVQFYSSIGNL